ncbi:MAG: hypothetical protein IKM54_05765, partial [Butyricicoccus sp.]|nr:hypothetical protein [Butyricicoccus sp.]
MQTTKDQKQPQPPMGGPGRGPGRGPMMGKPPKPDGKTIRRLLSYVGKYYKFHLIAVFVCIILSTAATVSATM